MSDVRPWLAVPDPDLARRALEYLRRFVFVNEEGMPEPDAELAEVALSLVMGVAAGLTSDRFMYEAAGDTVDGLERGETPATLFAQSDEPPAFMGELLVIQAGGRPAQALVDGETVPKVIARVDVRRNKNSEEMTLELIFDIDIAAQFAGGLGHVLNHMLETGIITPKDFE